MNDIKISSSLNSSNSNEIERKISLEEKRSVTSSMKANSLNSSQQLNDSGKSISSAEHHQHNNSIGNLKEEDETLETEDDDGGRCVVM